MEVAMKSGLILYKSKYGSTEKYAKWLQEETSFALMKTDDAKLNDVLSYDVIVLGGGLYASGLAGFNFIKKNFRYLSDKVLIVFCVGASHYESETILEWTNTYLKGELTNIKVFYLRGAWNLEKMSFKDRMMCKLLIKMTSKKDTTELEAWEKALLEASSQNRDWTDRSNLDYMIDYIESIL